MRHLCTVHVKVMEIVDEYFNNGDVKEAAAALLVSAIVF